MLLSSATYTSPLAIADTTFAGALTVLKHRRAAFYSTVQIPPEVRLNAMMV